MKQKILFALSNAGKQLLYQLPRQLVPNLGTILVVTAMPFAYRAWAAPETSSVGPDVTPGLFSYQGYLTDASGSPLNGNVNVTFRLYNVPSGGAALWTEAHTGGNAVPVSDGLFNVLLGSLTPIPSNVWNDDMIYLGVRVGSDAEMIPREVVGAVPAAVRALTVPDGSVTSGKLGLSGNLDLGGDGSGDAWWTGDYNNLMLRNTGGHVRLVSAESLIFFLDSDNDGSEARFRIGRNNSSWSNPIVEVFQVRENGYIDARGTLDMHGNSIINQGAMVEANLQTPDELAAESIDRFSEGDVLCWGEDRLELCAQVCDPLVQAVADESGKPVIIGAEVIKVIGPVQRGDLLVASEEPGYAAVWSSELHPPAGSVIAQALEVFGGERGMIKAMIRKF